MVATWIESSAKGRHGGPVRAGMWSAVVVGTHPIEADQAVWLEIEADAHPLGPLPAFWLENKGVNSLWHVPVPPQAVGARLRYQSAAHREGGPTVFSPHQEVVVRPNLPDRAEPATAALGSEGLAGNRNMTVRIDPRGSTCDVFFPTTGLHSDIRPAEGDRPESRTHFRTIMGGLAIGSRLEWFDERLSWEAFQRYQGATNLLVTSLRWRHGPIRVVATDFVATGPDLPRTPGGTESPGQYFKRFRVHNEGEEPRRALFGLFVQAEVNGNIGEAGLSWQDGDRTLLATNRGHGHANRKLARDATVEFAVALDDRGEAHCETSGPNEAMILRWLDLPPGGSVDVDVLVSGAFTGWRGDLGTFEHWLRPALEWFRQVDLDRLEREAADTWNVFVEPLPTLHFPQPVSAVALRRSALGAAIHADAKWGAIASGYDLGLHAYCWPRDAIFVGGAFDRIGHPEIGRAVFDWLARVRSQNRPYTYWFQKYTTDGWPEWETPAVDQTALIPWALERHLRRTGDLEFVDAHWSLVMQAAGVCEGNTGHPGLSRLDDLALISSAGVWDNRYGAFLYSNVCVVAGLRAAGRLAERLGHTEKVASWKALADRIWEVGILGESVPGTTGPGLVDRDSGRFLDARRLSMLRGLWSHQPEALIERSAALDVSLLGPVVPFGLLPANDARIVRLSEALLQSNAVPGDTNALTCWSAEPDRPEARLAPSESHQHDPSSLATLWMARYLIRLGRETGDGRHWTRAVLLLDDILAHLGPLGLALNLGDRRGLLGGPRRSTPGVWALHAMLIETMLDLAGLDYDAESRSLLLEPALPPDWPQVGLEQPFACGHVSYQLSRSGASAYRLILDARLKSRATLQVDLTCPGLDAIGPWRSQPDSPMPRFDRQQRRLLWSQELPVGESHWVWSWGGD